MAYPIKINATNTPEQEIFMSFQCSILSIPAIEGEYIQFNSQVVEYNGKNRTEIPITCICSIHDLRMTNRINKLQKGNKMDIIGNLIKNDEEIVVLIIYIVYVNNTNNFSSFDKKNTIATLPWLNPSITINEDLLQDTNNDFLNFVNNHTQNKVDKVDKTDDIINVSYDDTSKGTDSFITLIS